MTDLETIHEMLTRARIPFEEDKADRTITVGEESICGGRYGEVEGVEYVRYVGYFGFYSRFYFDKDGALLNLGAWE